MKKWLLLSICGLFGLSLSGCSLQDAIQNVLPSREEAIQDINPDSTRVYMDELQGTLQTFSGTRSLLSVLQKPILLMFLRLRWKLPTEWCAEILSA